MKKLLIVIISVFIFYGADAQVTGIYLKAGAGLAFALAGQTVDNMGIPLNGSITYVPANPNLVNNFDLKKASFSSGMQALAAGGYMFNENIGLELDLNVIPIPAKFEVYEYDAYNPAHTDVGTGHLTRQLDLPFFITPSLVYSTGSTNEEGQLKHFSLYARGGIVLPIVNKMVEELRIDYPTSGEDEYVKQETKMKFGAGLSGAMGIKYNVNKNFGLWVEFNMLAMSLYTSESTVTDHTLNGDPSTRTPIAGTVIKYITTGNYGLTQQPVYSIPFSNFGLNAGIMVFLKTIKEEATRKK